MASLLKWDKIASEGLELSKGKQVFEMPTIQTENLIRSQVRLPNEWQNLTKQLQVWQNDPTSKLYLNRSFNFE